MPPSTASESMILRALAAEAHGLGVINSHATERKLIGLFSDIDACTERDHQANLGQLRRQLVRGGIIDGTRRDKRLRRAFLLAHIAACCCLFNGFHLRLKKANATQVSEQIHLQLQRALAHGTLTPQALDQRLHDSDAVRTIFLLRTLGLAHLRSEHQNQLSLAPGPGNRDIQGAHAIPRVTATPGNPEEHVMLSVGYRRPRHITLIDNDPQLRESYTTLNQQEADWLQALNEPLEAALPYITQQVRSGHIRPMSLVLSLRFDHLMIPDSRKFFEDLLPVLDTSSTLVMSIGAGHSPQEFEGRRRTIRSILALLREAGQNPVLITLHGKGSIEQQRNSPLFGHSAYTAYEILHCKLDRERLETQLA